MNFKVGDKVTAYGLKGEVAQVNDVTNYLNRNTLCVRVLFIEAGFDQWFLEDGKVDPRHKEPALKLLSPSKRIVKKTLFVAVQTSPDRGSTRGGHATSHAHVKREDVVDMFHAPHQVVEVEIDIEE